MQDRQFHPDLWQQVERQATDLPSIYANVDFSQLPERFTFTPSNEGLQEFAHLIPDIMADKPLIELMAAYTLTGDAVADAYAARIPEFGFRQIVQWLHTTCDKGLEATPEAPPELAAFLHAMEVRPRWLDMNLVREGARIERNHYAHLVPFAIRGAFLATFMNKYSALPMALTGQLSDQLAAKRVHETATFFTLTVMPGALERNGAAFKAAAMGTYLVCKSDWKGAVPYLKAATNGPQQNASYYISLVQTRQLIGDFAPTLAELSEAESKAPPRAPYIPLRVASLMGLKQPVEALALAEQCKTEETVTIGTACMNAAGKTYEGEPLPPPGQVTDAQSTSKEKGFLETLKSAAAAAADEISGEKD